MGSRCKQSWRHASTAQREVQRRVKRRDVWSMSFVYDNWSKVDGFRQWRSSMCSRASAYTSKLARASRRRIPASVPRRIHCKDDPPFINGQIDGWHIPTKIMDALMLLKISPVYS